MILEYISASHVVQKRIFIYFMCDKFKWAKDNTKQMRTLKEIERTCKYK